MFIFYIYLNDVGPKILSQIMTLTLTLNIFIFSSSCLHLSMFRSQAAIVSKKSTDRKDYVPKFDLAVK